MPRRNDSTNAAKNGKSFEHFLELPSELRMMIMTEMTPEDRWRFTRCSSLCQKEAKSCDNFVYELSIRVNLQNSVIINVTTSEYENDNDRKGFILKYVKNETKNLLECLTIQNGRTLWIQELDGCLDRIDLAREHFKSLVMFYHKSIRKLIIHIPLFTNNEESFDFRTKKFKHLEEHIMVDDFVVLKTRNPMNMFGSFAKVDNETLVSNFDQISDVQKILHLPNVPFKLEQFQQISAEVFKIHIGTLTEEDILKFIRSWQNGTLGRKFEWCQWTLSDSKFHYRRLFRLLGAQEDSYMTLQSKKELGESGELRYLNGGILLFTTSNSSS